MCNIWNECCISQAPCSSVTGAALASLCAVHGGNGLVDNPSRKDAAGNTCIFAAAAVATCTAPDGTTTCNNHNADTCVGNTDQAGARCVFNPATTKTCTDPDGGSTCNAHNANSALCTSKIAKCAGVPCVATDAATCCKPSAKCSSMSIAKVKNVCGNSGSLVANPSTVSCNGLVCTSADKVQCCQPSQLWCHQVWSLQVLLRLASHLWVWLQQIRLSQVQYLRVWHRFWPWTGLEP